MGGADLSSELSFANSYTNVPGGSTTWTFNGGTNYNDANGTTTVTINKATLHIYADNASRQYSDPNPEFTGNYSGSKNDEEFNMSYSTSAVINSAPGDL